MSKKKTNEKNKASETEAKTGGKKRGAELGDPTKEKKQKKECGAEPVTKSVKKPEDERMEEGKKRPHEKTETEPTEKKQKFSSSNSPSTDAWTNDMSGL